MELTTPLQYVKGIGPARAEMLAAKGLQTVADLLYYAPFRYEDRRNIKPISQLAPGEKAVVLAQVSSGKLTKFRRTGPALFEATLRDGSGAHLHARWFHGERFADTLVAGARLALFGKVELDHGHGNRLMVQPEIEILPEEDPEEMLHTGRIVAVYEAAGKISTRVFRTLLDRVLKDAPMPEDAVPESVRQRVGLPDLASAIRETHAPAQEADLRLLNEFRTPA
ncbi:MAG: ATP-dependent DNA helicase RecG, partial [Acidobacteriaceae bacterium]|nr:ATP-dependent DNA helicase RecG [Acidobacteriaceae bacterium]